MNNTDYNELLKWVESETLKLGAVEVAGKISSNRGMEISVRDGELESMKESVQSQLSVQIYYRGRYSTHQTNALDRGRLQGFLKNALDMTGYLAEDKARHLPDPSFYPASSMPDLQLRDRRIAELDQDTKLSYLETMSAAGKSLGPDIISFTAKYWDNRNSSWLRFSNGFSDMQESTVIGMGASLSMNDPSGKKPEGWKYLQTRFAEDLAAPSYLAEEAYRRTVNKMGAKKIKSSRMKMLVTNDAVMRILYPLVRSLDARSLYLDQSYLKGKKGEKIASELLTIKDSPFIPRGIGSRNYDGEGLAAREMDVLSGGILKNYYIDSYYGEKMAETPNAGGPSNWVFSTGSRSLGEMISDLDEAILVDSFIGGNSNNTTGDFSYGIMGRYIQNGELKHPVAEMNISGNMQELLANILELGNDPYIYSSYRTPSILIDNVDFAGL